MISEQFIQFLINYKFVILFYVLILATIIINRKKFDFQAKFIAMYRTKIGIKLMDKWGEKYREFIRLLGVIGIGIGFVGMIYIFVYVLQGFIKLFTTPDAPATLSLVLPGVHIPGSAIFIPFWHGIIALFIVVAVHEFGHGVVARANKIPVHHSGIVFFGPLIGAFVEPDEKQLMKEDDVKKYSVFAAGPFFNALLAAFAILLVAFAFTPTIDMMVEPVGVSFQSIQENMPAYEAGLLPEVTYDMVNGNQITTADQFILELNKLKPGDNFTIGDSTNTYTITTTESPTDSSKAYVGVVGIMTTQNVKEGFSQILVDILRWFNELFVWIFMLSLGLGAANLLPLGPVDGGRMIQLALTKIFGDKKGHVIWVKTGFMLLFILLVLIFFPILKSTLF